MIMPSTYATPDTFSASPTGKTTVLSAGMSLLRTWGCSLNRVADRLLLWDFGYLELQITWFLRLFGGQRIWTHMIWPIWSGKPSGYGWFLNNDGTSRQQHNGPCIVKSSACIRADSRLVPSQRETSLQSNAVSHWLGSNLESRHTNM